MSEKLSPETSKGITVPVDLIEKPQHDSRFYAEVAGRLWNQQKKIEDQERVVDTLKLDSLTGLPNRHVLDHELPLYLQRTERNGRKIGVAFVDVNSFKHVNDTFGHAVGDEYLRGVASGMLEAVRPGDRAYRRSGDEFVMILDGDIEIPKDETEEVAESIKARIKDRVNHHLSLFETNEGVSVGVAFSEPFEDAESLMGRADALMYADKPQNQAQPEQ